MSEPLITILVDTREQRPWQFDASRFNVVRVKLQTGDYTIRGLETQFRIERKSLGDAVGSFVSDWLRFKKELLRLSCYDHAAIVVEADIEDVLAKRYESNINPASVIGRANAIWMDRGIPVFWWGRKSGCVSMVESLMSLAVKKLGATTDTGMEEAAPTLKAVAS